MKKNHHDAVQYRERRASKLHRRRNRKKEAPSAPLQNAHILKCPPKLDVMSRKSRAPFLKMLSHLHTCVAAGATRIHLDFSGLSRIFSEAGILLRAEIERTKALYPQVVIRGTPPRNTKCAHVLTQIGVGRLCGMPAQRGTHDDVIHWRAVTGKDVDGEAYATELMAPYEDRLPKGIDNSLYIGVSEAMTNVAHHAYIKAREDSLRRPNEQERQWWMFSQERNGLLQVVICDLGVGIPRTLPESQRPELAAVVRWMRSESRSDSDILSAVLKKTVRERPRATAHGETISRTGETHRGRGLYNIVRAVRGVDNAAIGVMSNKGCWFKQTGQPDGVKVAFKDSIRGTIIFWSIRIEQ